MSQLLRLLLLTPTLMAPVLSLLTVTKSVHASGDVWVPVSKDLTCVYTVVQDSKQLSCKRIKAGMTEDTKVIDLTKQVSDGTIDRSIADQGLTDTFDMTDEESNTAVALFGCDCPACVRSLRQLRSMTVS